MTSSEVSDVQQLLQMVERRYHGRAPPRSLGRLREVQFPNGPSHLMRLVSLGDSYLHPPTPAIWFALQRRLCLGTTSPGRLPDQIKCRILRPSRFPLHPTSTTSGTLALHNRTPPTARCQRLSASQIRSSRPMFHQSQTCISSQACCAQVADLRIASLISCSRP